MTPTLVWDLPTRLMHWMLAAGFVAAAVLALVLGEDSPLFPYHAIIGLALALLVGLRLAWGVLGTRYARFASFAFGPGAVLGYGRGALLGGGVRHVGHNPGSAYAIFAMLALLAGLAATGVALGRGMEGAGSLHELLAYAMVAVASIHVVGVLLHTLRFRENIVGSMIHGRKHAEPVDGIASARPLAAIFIVGLTVAWVAGLVRNYDPATRTTTLPVLGASLALGESETEESEAAEAEDEDD